MEGEAFSDPTIAAYLNQHFLPIKVDREERPDLDSIYMQALQMMVGQGGWPLNIFLDPQDLLPFYGGTYFPAQARYGRPGFLQVLQVLRQTYDTDQERLRDIRQEIFQHLTASATATQGGQSLAEGLLLKGLEYSTRILSPNFGGNSFPMMPYAQAALRLVRFEGERSIASQQACVQRGLDLALGGIFDHVGGGFHRYTVDPTWTVPHFEKMLYDNGQILEYLGNLWGSGCQEAAFGEAVAKTVAWLRREMLAPEGYFYASQDADSFVDSRAAEPEEGEFYCWSYDQLQNCLKSEELAALTRDFTISEGGNFEGRNVLQRRRGADLDPASRSALTQLFTLRYGAPETELQRFAPARNNQEAKVYGAGTRDGSGKGRIPPVTDVKMILSWNSLMISGLARSAVAFDRPQDFDLACDVAQGLLTHQWQGDHLYRLNYGSASADPISQEVSAAPSATAFQNGQDSPAMEPEGQGSGNPAGPGQDQGDAGQGLSSQGLASQGLASQGLSSQDRPRVAVLAQSEDYALLIKALFDLHQASVALPDKASLAPTWLAEAQRLQRVFDQELWSEELGGYYNASLAGSQHLVVRERNYTDGAVPSTNGIAALNLLRLHLLTDEAAYYDRAERVLQAFSGTMTQATQTCPSLFQALDVYRNGTVLKARPETIAAIAPGYWPTVVFQVSEDLPTDGLGLVCAQQVCVGTAQTLAALKAQLQRQSTRSL